MVNLLRRLFGGTSAGKIAPLPQKGRNQPPTRSPQKKTEADTAQGKRYLFQKGLSQLMEGVSSIFGGLSRAFKKEEPQEKLSPEEGLRQINDICSGLQKTVRANAKKNAEGKARLEAKRRELSQKKQEMPPVSPRTAKILEEASRLSREMAPLVAQAEQYASLSNKFGPPFSQDEQATLEAELDAFMKEDKSPISDPIQENLRARFERLKSS